MATKSDKAGKAAKKTIIDVTHADSAAPSPNSKSVIVPSRPILKDPMVVEKSEEGKEDPTTKAAEKNIMPDAANEPTTAPTVAELAEAAAENDKQASEEKTKKEAEKKPAEAPEKPEKTETSDAKEPDKSDEPDGEEKPAKPDDAAIEAEAAEQAKHEAAIDKLVESKQYYLPIETIEKRRSKRFVGLGILLSLLLIIAWADIALDAGLIQIGGVKPVTHLFSN